MAPVKPGSATVTILRAALVKDPRSGEFIRDWANATQIPIAGCSVQPFAIAQRLNVEYLNDREFAKGFLRVYAPADADVTKDDHALWRGEEFEIFGFPTPWDDLESVPHHVAFILERRSG